MPRATGDEDQNYVRVVNASDVETLFGAASGDTEELWKKMSFIRIDSNMVPYVSARRVQVLSRRVRPHGT